MNLFYFIFVWIAIMALVSQEINVYYETSINNKTVYRWKFIYAFIAFLPVIYLVVYTQPRFDTVLYMIIYRNLPISLNGLITQLTTANGEYGFILFEWVIKNISNGSETIYRLIIALIHSIPVLYLFRKYSCNYILSLFLFVASGCHIAWMMNGLRQFIAVSLVMAATPFLIKKKYIPLIVLILVAISFHNSAIIMLLIVFIVQGKPWNKRTLLFILVSIIMMYLLSKNSMLLDIFFENTKYSNVMQNATNMGDDGVNPIRVLVNSIPMLMSLIGRKYLEEDNNPIVNICINMSIITSSLYLIAMVTSGIMLGRLPIYTSLYSYILLPYIVRRIFEDGTQKLINFLMIVFYFLYYLYGYRGI